MYAAFYGPPCNFQSVDTVSIVCETASMKRSSVLCPSVPSIDRSSGFNICRLSRLTMLVRISLNHFVLHLA